jgi:hypothetical protein
MKNRIVTVIATIMLMGCATPTDAEVITGFTVHGAPACGVSDLSTESMDLVTLWWSLNKKREDGTITPEEYAQGAELFRSGQCGLLQGGIPVTIVLSDGTIYLLQYRDGDLQGVTDGAFTETPPELEPVTGKEFKIDED